MDTNYREEHIQEKSLTPFSLLSGEHILLQGKFGMPVSMVYAAIVFTFVPPFFWGVLIVLVYRFAHKHNGIVVTNWRLVTITKFIGDRYFHVESIPLSHIKSITLGSLKGTFILNTIDRMFGVSDLQVHFKLGSYRLLTEVKRPRELINTLTPLLTS